MNLTKSYIDTLAYEVQRTAEPDAISHQEDLPLYRFYAVLVLAKGIDVTAEDVHNAWAAWASEHDPGHRNLLPFKELSLSVQHKDQLYVDAIHLVASKMQPQK